MSFLQTQMNGVEIFTGENDLLKFTIAPAAGGKILSIYNKRLQKEFLWTNKNLNIAVYPAGTDYDSHFFGGIDELIPNDIPENINAVEYPDHGELWTTSLEHKLQKNQISVFGDLKLSGLFYKKTVRLDDQDPVIYLDYIIRNDSGHERNFLWKLHAALAIEAGDYLVSSARTAQIADPAYSRFSDAAEFQWPLIENVNASVVPENNGSIDFFYLSDVARPEMKMLMDNQKYLFSYQYDEKIFPYQWYFASYGGFMKHYTAVLEPCSSKTMSVNESMLKSQCTILKPGQQIETTVRIWAGDNLQT